MVAIPSASIMIIGNPTHMNGAISVREGGITVTAIIASIAVVIGVYARAQQ